MLIVCAWCKKDMGVASGTALAAEYAGREPEVTHGICPACYAAELAKFSPAPSSAKDEAPYTFPGEPGGGHLTVAAGESMCCEDDGLSDEHRERVDLWLGVGHFCLIVASLAAALWAAGSLLMLIFGGD